MTINEKSVDGVLGIQTQGNRMGRADEATELCAESQFSNVVWGCMTRHDIAGS